MRSISGSGISESDGASVRGTVSCGDSGFLSFSIGMVKGSARKRPAHMYRPWERIFWYTDESWVIIFINLVRILFLERMRQSLL